MRPRLTRPQGPAIGRSSDGLHQLFTIARQAVAPQAIIRRSNREQREKPLKMPDLPPFLSPFTPEAVTGERIPCI